MTPYWLNGRKRYIVDRNETGNGPAAKQVFNEINRLKSFDWTVLYNHFDSLYDGAMPKSVEDAIDHLSVE